MFSCELTLRGIKCPHSGRRVPLALLLPYQISALAGLAQINLLTQNRGWNNTIPASSVLFALSHLVFGVLHWLAFVVVVGVSKERNPFGLGLKNTGMREGAGGYGEVTANVEFRHHGEEEGEFEQDDDGVYAEAQSVGRWQRPVKHSKTPRGKGRRAQGVSATWDDELAARRMANEASMLSDGSGEDEDDDMPIDRAFPRYPCHRSEDEDSTSGQGDGAGSQGSVTGEDGDDDDDDDYADTDSDEDPNDIIDIIPSPSTSRYRAISTSQSFRSLRSRHSIYNVLAGSPEEEEGQEHDAERGQGGPHNLTALSGRRRARSQNSPDQRPLSKGYGTFRSLAGI